MSVFKKTSKIGHFEKFQKSKFLVEHGPVNRQGGQGGLVGQLGGTFLVRLDKNSVRLQKKLLASSLKFWEVVGDP